MIDINMMTLSELRNSLTIQWLTNLSEIESLQNQWMKLESEVLNRSTASCFDWVMSWYKHYGIFYGRPLLGIATLDKKVVGIAPFVVRKATLGKVPVLSVDFVGFNAESGEFLIIDGMEEIIFLFLESLNNTQKVDVISLNGFENGSKELSIINRFIDYHGYICETIKDRYAIVDLKEGYSAYFSSLKSKIRNSYKRHKRKITDAGQWEIEQINGYVDEDVILNGVKRMFSVYNRSWKAARNGEISEPHCGFYEEVVLKFAKRGMVDLCFLKLDGKDIAFVLWLVDRDCYYDVKVSYDEEYASLSPGIFLMHELLKILSQNNIHTVISHGDRDYKKNWVTAFIARYRIFIFNNGFKSKLSHLIKFKIPRKITQIRCSSVITNGKLSD